MPAELILLDGKPKYKEVEGTSLLWVSNTESDIFRLGKTGLVYYLVAGRWFSAPDFTGPWTFASTVLPDDFKKIPEAHERSRVLASVPGSDQAMEAVLLAQIPETARVSKKLTAPMVQYQGDPMFEPIEKTMVSRAVNTDKDIIKVGDIYYMCFQGVWFMGRSPTGPWEVTGTVPKEIYEIPVSSPSHAVTYVTVEEDNDDAVIFATAAMYTGVMIAWGCAVWGSGYYYPPYYYGGGFYPYYRPSIRPTDSALPTIRGQARTRAALWRMVRMVAQAWRRDTTRPRVPIRVAPRRGVPTARAARPPRTTRAPERLPRRGRAPASMGAGDRLE